MSRRAVNQFLLVWLLTTWGAFLLRVDHFPLTWAPMYSVFKPKETFRIRVMDKKRIKRGFEVTHRDGSTSRVGPDELNIPFRNMRRLYAQRAFGKAPPKHEQANASLGGSMGDDDAVYGPVEWDWRLFWSLNKTLGHEPDDPGFVTRIEASIEWIYFARSDLHVMKREKERATLEWDDAWRQRWK